MTEGAWPLRNVDRHGRPVEAGSHYTTNEIMGDAMEILRDLEPDDINWVFLSTSGVHGSYMNLDDAEKLWTDPRAYREANCLAPTDDLPTEETITVLIVLPRMVTTMFGTATLRSLDDVALLRTRVEQTFAGITERQAGNRARPVAP